MFGGHCLANPPGSKFSECLEVCDAFNNPANPTLIPRLRSGFRQRARTPAGRLNLQLFPQTGRSHYNSSSEGAA